MSLTEDMSLLVGRANALITTFENKKTGIDAALAAALAATMQLSRVVHVDPITGSDTAIGDLDHPVMTLDRAALMVANFPFGIIRIFGDVQLNTRVYVYCQSLEISGFKRDPNSLGFVAQSRKVTFAALAGTRFDGAPQSAGIEFQVPCNVALSAIETVIPVVAPTTVVSSCLSYQGSGALILRGCGIDAAGDTTARLAYVWNPAVLTFGVTNTAITAAALGKVLSNVPAGGNPNTQWMYRSNLTSL